MNDFVVSINNKKHSVGINDIHCVEVNGKKIRVELSILNNETCLLKYGDKVYEVTSNRIDNNRYGFLINGWYFDATVRTKLQETINELIDKKDFRKKNCEIRAPMPGLILSIKKHPGDKVKKGDPLIIFEAMKMENELRSTVEGIVKEVFIKEGDTVEKKFLLFVIE